MTTFTTTTTTLKTETGFAAAINATECHDVIIIEGTNLDAIKIGSSWIVREGSYPAYSGLSALAALDTLRTWK